jgi:hypothetical protein
MENRETKRKGNFGKIFQPLFGVAKTMGAETRPCLLSENCCHWGHKNWRININFKTFPSQPKDIPKRDQKIVKYFDNGKVKVCL